MSQSLASWKQLPLPCNFTDEIGGMHVQSARQVEHDRQSRHVLAAFEKADVADVQVGQFRELLLRQAAFRTQSANNRAERFRVRIGFYRFIQFVSSMGLGA
jgi:hypothetical protein